MTEDNRHNGFINSKTSVEDNNHLALAKQFGMTVFQTLSLNDIETEWIQKIPYSFAKKYEIVPLKKKAATLLVATADPLNLSPIEELSFLLNETIEAVYSPRSEILTLIHECYNKKDGAASQMIADLKEETKTKKDDDDVEVYDLLDDSMGQAPVVKLLNLILTEAIQQGASDVHFEPNDSGMRVRYRIDGVLQNRHSPAHEYQSSLITRIKVMAKLDIAEHRLPQDGRIKLKLGQREIDFRVSTVPVTGGERIVMRILDKGNILLGMDRIGMPKDLLTSFEKMIHLPEGIVLVTGPTGSGKTTTLYSALHSLNSDEVNIMTVEDPVEYNLKGIAQIGVKPQIDLTFARGLRHILRQDPDVVMLGEIRDQETAEIAIQASLTGHLVLSTLHTNDAPSAITRLVDMDIEPYLLSSSLIGVLAQRLVRKICPDCKESYTPSTEELTSLGISQPYLCRGKGCSSCYGCGYKGRHALYELLTIDNAIKRQIVQSPDAIELRRIALSQGMLSLFSHGVHLVQEGITTLAEILRVSRGLEEVE